MSRTTFSGPVASTCLLYTSDAATITASAVAFGRLVVAAGATGMAKFTLMFSGGDGVSPTSATAYTLTRTA